MRSIPTPDQLGDVPPRRSQHGHFPRFNALVEQFIWSLSLQEIRVLLRFERRAAADGTTWAGYVDITDDGKLMDRRHYYRALKSLTKKGLLVEVGHRANGAAIRQVLPNLQDQWQVPPLTDSATGENCLRHNPPVAEFATADVADSATELVADSATRSAQGTSQVTDQRAQAGQDAEAEVSGPFLVGPTGDERTARTAAAAARERGVARQDLSGDPVTREGLAAISSWSASAPSAGGIGRPLNVEANEAAAVFRLINFLRDRNNIGTIQRGSERVSPELLIPQAVKALRDQHKTFKNPKYACGCIRSELQYWADTGIPSAASSPQKRPSPLMAQKERIAALPRPSGDIGANQ